MSSRHRNLAGIAIGTLTAVSYSHTDKGRCAVWTWKCTCGKTVKAPYTLVNRGRVHKVCPVNKKKLTKKKETDRVMIIGPALKRYRAKNNIFSKDIAKVVGVSPAQMCKIESGQCEPKGETSLKILEILIPTLKNDIMLLEIDHEFSKRKP